MEPCRRGEHGVQCDVSEDRDAQDHDDGFGRARWMAHNRRRSSRQGEKSRKSWLQASVAMAEIKCA